METFDGFMFYFRPAGGLIHLKTVFMQTSPSEFELGPDPAANSDKCLATLARVC